MAINTKTITLLSLLCFAVIAIAASITTKGRYKNLKILPQDISEKKMDSIMEAYSKALNVSCDFCHTKTKSDTLDFALDNGMKENARKMITLTINLNKEYFYFDSTIRPEYLNVVSCNTCHRGNPYPVNE